MPNIVQTIHLKYHSDTTQSANSGSFRAGEAVEITWPLPKVVNENTRLGFNQLTGCEAQLIPNLNGTGPRPRVKESDSFHAHEMIAGQLNSLVLEAEATGNDSPGIHVDLVCVEVVKGGEERVIENE